MREVLIPGGSGHAFEIPKGKRFRVVDVEGKQVSDLVAFLNQDRTERSSPANTRKLNHTLKITTEGIIYSTKCRSLLKITADSVGEHDLIFSSCSEYDYRVRFGFTTYHNSCLSILTNRLAPYGLLEHQIPDPFNIFQRTAIGPDGSIETLEPRSKAGDFIEFQAEEDCLMALTACPQDQNPCNGWKVTDIKLIIL